MKSTEGTTRTRGSKTKKDRRVAARNDPFSKTTFNSLDKMDTNKLIDEREEKKSLKCTCGRIITDGAIQQAALQEPCRNTSAESQRGMILAHLKTNQSLTTLHAREVMGILHPAARVMGLRKRGHNIETVWINEIDSTGIPHRIAKYILSDGE